MFKLSDLLEYDTIMIQCHDIPDADTISCAFAIQAFLREKGKDAKIFYSGAQKITKVNLITIIEKLKIEIEHIRMPSLCERPDLLICVDCQYGEGNTTKFEANAVAEIDHHLQTKGVYYLGVIRPELGSCATVVWDLLRDEGFDFVKHKDVATALYYGLYTDTVSFTEIRHPLDMDMRDTLAYDEDLLKRLRFTNLTFEELEIAGVALLRNSKNVDRRYAIFKAEPCDPNILGFVADLALQVNNVDVCVVYTQNESRARLSVRSCTREIMASEYIEYLTSGVGSGGGHKDKAGGFVMKAAVDEMGIGISEYLEHKTSEYFASFDIIIASEHNIDTAGMMMYRRMPVPRGYVVSSDIFDEGTPVEVHAIRSNPGVIASPDVFLIVGIKGEVYPSTTDRFRASYSVSDEPLQTDFKYNPTAKNKITGEVKELMPHIKTCVPLGKRRVYVTQLTRNTKVFTDLDPEGYIYGRPGDYLAVNCRDSKDVYIVPKNVFKKTYEKTTI